MPPHSLPLVAEILVARLVTDDSVVEQLAVHTMILGDLTIIAAPL